MTRSPSNDDDDWWKSPPMWSGWVLVILSGITLAGGELTDNWPARWVGLGGLALSGYVTLQLLRSEYARKNGDPR